MENQVNYMWNEYELTLRDAAQLRDETMNDLAEMKKQTQTIKEAIRRLGDVNVNAIEDYKNLMERYTFLKAQLTAHTQFIVITHRRGTMEAADRLYGITMQEKGVSTLVSVNLIDKDLT